MATTSSLVGALPHSTPPLGFYSHLTEGQPGTRSLHEACEAANAILDTTSVYIGSLRDDVMQQARGMKNHLERMETFRVINVGRTALHAAYQVAALGFVSDSIEIDSNRWVRIADAAYLLNEQGLHIPVALRAGIFALQIKRGSDFGGDASKREGVVDSVFVPPGVHIFYGKRMITDGMVLRPHGVPAATDEIMPEPLVLSNFTQGRSRARHNIRSDDLLGYPVASQKSIETRAKLVSEICATLAKKPFPKHPLMGSVALPESISSYPTSHL